METLYASYDNLLHELRSPWSFLKKSKNSNMLVLKADNDTSVRYFLSIQLKNTFPHLFLIWWILWYIKAQYYAHNTIIDICTETRSLLKKLLAQVLKGRPGHMTLANRDYMLNIWSHKASYTLLFFNIRLCSRMSLIENWKFITPQDYKSVNSHPTQQDEKKSHVITVKEVGWIIVERSSLPNLISPNLTEEI